MAGKTTKERLIEAASEIFAEKGYRETTVAEICEKAEANIAAVNYHFGDKANLYFEVWGYLSAQANAQFPILEDYKEVGAEEWLRQLTRTRLQCIQAKSPAGLFPKLIHREMNDLTQMHETLFNTYLRPLRMKVRDVIAAFLEYPVDEAQLSAATINFMGTHISINVGYQKHRDHPTLLKKFPEEIEGELLRQVESFAIGGLKEVKKDLAS